MDITQEVLKRSSTAPKDGKAQRFIFISALKEKGLL